MTTSHSWFDQEKFSRLIKKVGPKTASGPAAEPAAKAAPSIQVIKTTPAPASSPATSPAAKPPSESRLIPTSPAQSTPTPLVKPIFTYAEPPAVSSVSAPPPSTKISAEVRPIRAKEASQDSAPPENGNATVTPDLQQANQDLAEAWEKIAALNEELSRTIEEREQARTEGVVLRDQLRQAEQITDDRATLMTQIDELTSAVAERDNSLSEYADLRELYEALKREVGRPREELGPDRTALEQEIGSLRQQLAEQQAIGAQANNTGMEEMIETLRQEVSSLQEQVNQSREETSSAQRGLMLSQKTLQETRDALREATEGSSMTKGNLDNLKNECATLVQQNMLLQAQLDQVSRELSAAKAKLSARG